MAKISKYGEVQNVFSRDLCNKIRKRLKKTKGELSDSTIRKVIKLSNKEIANWIIDNPEGYKLDKMGYLVTSKYMFREFMDDIEDKKEFVKNLNTWGSKKERILRNYNKKIPFYNKFRPISHMYYMYKVMWFNKRNCSLKKAEVYWFEMSDTIRKRITARVKSGKGYYEWNFTDFYHHKMENIE